MQAFKVETVKKLNDAQMKIKFALMQNAKKENLSWLLMRKYLLLNKT